MFRHLSYWMLRLITNTLRLELITIVCIFLSCNTVYSQLTGFNFIEPDLLDINPEWIYVSYEADIVDLVTNDSVYVYDGYNHIISYNDKSPQPLIYDGFLFKLNSTLYNNDLAGIMIEKIDIVTGELIWQMGFDPRDADHDYCEHILKAEIEGNSLRLYNLRLLPFGPSSIFGFVWGHLMQRRIDLDTGEQIGFEPADTSSQNAALIKSAEAQDLEIVTHSDQDLIEIFNVTGENSFSEKELLIDSINNLGQRLNPQDTIKALISNNLVLSDYLTSKWLKLIKDDTALYWLQYYAAKDNNMSQTNYADIVKVKSNGVLDTIHLDDVGDFQNIQTMQFETQSDSSLVLFVESIDDVGEFIEISKNDGSRISSSFYSECSYQHINRDYNTYANYKSEDFVIGALCNQIDAIISLVFKKEGSVLEPTKEVRLENPQYLIAVHEMVKIDETDYLLFFFYDERLCATCLSEGRFSGVMRVHERELGLITSGTSEFNTKPFDLAVYPNPSQEAFTLSLPEYGSYDINIIDDLGRTLYYEKSEGELEHRIDVGEFPTGHYQIIVHNEAYYLAKPVVIVR